MAKNTERLGLYMKDPETDGNDTFNITTMLNNNWERIDNTIAMVDENGKVVNKDGSPAGGVNSVNEKQGDVTLSKSDVGLSNVDNVKQATKDEFDNHEKDTVKHITSAERSSWNAKETPSGAQEKVDVHANLKNNPHETNKTDVGLGSVQDYGIATQAESEAGTSNAKYMTPMRTKQAIEKLTPEGISEQDVDDKIFSHAEDMNVHGLRSQVVVLGKGARANENQRGIAIGENARVLNYWYSMSIGFDASNSASNCIVIGKNSSSTTSASYGVAIGANSITNNANTGVLGVDSGDGANAWIVPGLLTVEGTKNFEMPHPHPDKKETHRLRHSAVESPTAGDNLYRFEIEATEALQEVEYELPDYFQYLNKDVDVWVNGIDHFGNAYGKVEVNTLKVSCELAGKYNVLVIGTRNDDHQSVQDWDIKGVEREVGESWTGETYVFEVDEILEIEEIKEEDVA